jgi:hypothetical protein
VESIHVLALCLFVGLATIFDLRLLGLILRRVPVSQVMGRTLPWTIGGFAVMVITGCCSSTRSRFAPTRACGSAPRSSS